MSDAMNNQRAATVTPSKIITMIAFDHSPSLVAETQARVRRYQESSDAAAVETMLKGDYSRIDFGTMNYIVMCGYRMPVKDPAGKIVGYGEETPMADVVLSPIQNNFALEVPEGARLAAVVCARDQNGKLSEGRRIFVDVGRTVQPRPVGTIWQASVEAAVSDAPTAPTSPPATETPKLALAQ